ncbi:hypothetical protein DFJ73DRAFT_226548 [Zopfochytrium polystomum]|nr:hypothetical protein DFJ73DRAFT_226548 [Zopfochytrium polystomum]
MNFMVTHNPCHRARRSIWMTWSRLFPSFRRSPSLFFESVDRVSFLIAFSTKEELPHTCRPEVSNLQHFEAALANFSALGRAATWAEIQRWSQRSPSRLEELVIDWELEWNTPRSYFRSGLRVLPHGCEMPAVKCEPKQHIWPRPLPKAVPKSDISQPATATGLSFCFLKALQIPIIASHPAGCELYRLCPPRFHP